MNTNNPNPEFSIIGCGRLGINLAVSLSRQGYTPVAFASKSRESAEAAQAFCETGEVFDDVIKAAESADLIFITTPDTTIEPVCRVIAEKKAFNEKSTVFHLSGALSSSILASAGKCGARVGSIHPLQAFAPYEEGQASPFKGINISIEGDAAAVDLGKEIVNSLNATSFTIPTNAKTAYHASAVVASNYLVTLENFALELLKLTEISESDAWEILEPLVMGTLNNIRQRGSIKALTGPVARGDDEIVARHLKDIDEKLPGFSKIYRVMGQYTMDIAVQGGQVSPEAQNKLKGLFKS